MQDRTDERNMRNARVWTYSGDLENPFTVFDFTETRRRDGPARFLGIFSGYLQADAFAGYDCIYAGGKVTEVVCWAHARRQFFDALPTNELACSQALAFIQALYRVEKEAQDVPSDIRAQMRKDESFPLLLKFKQWLNEHKLVALPKSPFGKAVQYALNNWQALCVFVQNGDLTIDNNRSERSLRGMAVGRKNWLFVGSAIGGQTATILATFIATCKAHHIHPRVYLEDVLKKMAAAPTDLDALLPGKWRPMVRS